MAEPQKNQTPPLKAVEPATDYREIELVEGLMNCTKVDRKSQRVYQLRAIEGVTLMAHPAGVEVGGNSTWRGVVPWSNIKVAKR